MVIKLVKVFKEENSARDTTSVCQQSVRWWPWGWTYCAAKIFMRTSMTGVYKRLSTECDSRQND